MYRPELLILIPCHSLEDFPTDLGETEAAGLLNAFAAACHPALLAATRELPAWKRADEPPDVTSGTIGPAGKLVIVPACAASWLPHRWSEYAAEAGIAVVEGVADRSELVSQLLAALLTLETTAAMVGGQETEVGGQTSDGGGQKSEVGGQKSDDEPPISDLRPPISDLRPPSSDLRPPISDLRPPSSDLDPELVADFFALGTALLQAELLTRRMHYYSNLDSGSVRLEAVAAAEAAMSGDGEQARRRLHRAFEMLLDARERYFPVDTYLIDLCLVAPDQAAKLPTALSPLEPSTLLASASDWEQIARDQPELIGRLKTDWPAHRVGLLGGEYREGPTSLLPVESLLWEFDRGRAAFQRLFDRTPKVWARRRFGFSTLIPQILDRAGIPYAVHAALDDGYYPDDELSKFCWDGCDGVGVDAFSRIPLAADSATSFLRFSQHLSESMEQDQSAAVMFARWPELSTPWLEDLRRIHHYAPVFGKFVSLDTFFGETDPPGRIHAHPSTGYFPPYLTQSVARGHADPIGRFGRQVLRRHAFDAAAWMSTIATLLGRPAPNDDLDTVEDAVERLAVETDADTAADGERQLASLTDSASRALSDAILGGGTAGPGVLVMNPLSFPRRTTIDLPDGVAAPAIEGPVRQVQFDDVRRSVVLDLPAGGFVWLPATSPAAPVRREEPPTAEHHVLRNEYFEVHLSEATGGIAYIKGYGRSPKRLSQQLAYRFPRKRRMTSSEWGDEETYYSAMQARSIELTCTGPALAEAVTTGDLIDQTNGSVLATFRQRIRVWRNRPVVEIDIELDPTHLPAGDPWTNYYGCRFAWNDSTAAVTRSVQQIAQPAPDGRFDAPHSIEIAEDELRTTIVPVGLPFHRRTGERMLDTLLLVAGETTRRFRFVIACDESYPQRAALDACVPPVVIECERGLSPSVTAGWFLRLDAKNVQITSLRPLPADETQPGGVRVRLLETEGQARPVRLSCFKPVTTARLVNLAGETTTNLTIADDTVTIDLHKFEIATVELRF